MSVLNVVVISDYSANRFQKEVKDFLNLNEDMIELDKTVYGITQEEYPDDNFGPNCMHKRTCYSAIFQIEGEIKR